MTQFKRPCAHLTVKQAAAYLDVSEKTVRRWISSGILPHLRLGGCIRISSDDLAGFLAVRRHCPVVT